MAVANAPSVKFNPAPTQAPGAQGTDVSVTVVWANCVGVTSVDLTLYYFSVDDAGNFEWKAAAQRIFPTVLVNGNKAWTIPTALPAGTVFYCEVIVLKANNVVIIAADSNVF